MKKTSRQSWSGLPPAEEIHQPRRQNSWSQRPQPLRLLRLLRLWLLRLWLLSLKFRKLWKSQLQQHLEDPSPTAAAAGPSPRPDAAGESENPKNAGMDSSMLPNAARSYKDTTGNWEAGFFRNNWMVFVTLFVFTICLSLSLFLLPLPCHSSAGVWVRATDRELEGRGLEKNCPPSRSYRRGSWEAAESRSSSNKWLLREEVAERRGVSPQQRKVARPCSPIHPFIHPSLHSFIR